MRWVAIILALAGCGGAAVEPAPDRIEIGTYLATPLPGQATRDAARTDCRTRGKRAQYVETRRNGRGGFRHIYDCLR